MCTKSQIMASGVQCFQWFCGEHKGERCIGILYHLHEGMGWHTWWRSGCHFCWLAGDHCCINKQGEWTRTEMTGRSRITFQDKDFQCIIDTLRKKYCMDPFVRRFISVENEWVKPETTRRKEVFVMIPFKVKTRKITERIVTASEVDNGFPAIHVRAVSRTKSFGVSQAKNKWSSQSTAPLSILVSAHVQCSIHRIRCQPHFQTHRRTLSGGSSKRQSKTHLKVHHDN